MKYPKESQKIFNQLVYLIESSEKDICRLNEKINTKKAECEEISQLIRDSRQKKAWAANNFLLEVSELKNAQTFTDTKEKHLEKKVELLEEEIKRSKTVLNEMQKGLNTLNELKNTGSQDNDFSELEGKLLQAKAQICSQENKELFSKHSGGYDWFSKIVAFFNSVFTKTIGEKNMNRIEEGLNKASSIAQKLSAQGVFTENSKIEIRENEFEDHSKEAPDENIFMK